MEKIKILDDTIIELRQNLKEEQEKADQAIKDLTNAVSDRPKSPIATPKIKEEPVPVQLVTSTSAGQEMLMAQIAAMDVQVKAIEARFTRREKELECIVEETRAASKMERARMAGLHAQELADKDAQLARFRAELEGLVRALREHALTKERMEEERAREEVASLRNDHTATLVAPV